MRVCRQRARTPDVRSVTLRPSFLTAVSGIRGTDFSGLRLSCRAVQTPPSNHMPVASGRQACRTIARNCRIPQSRQCGADRQTIAACHPAHLPVGLGQPHSPQTGSLLWHMFCQTAESVPVSLCQYGCPARHLLPCSRLRIVGTRSHRVGRRVRESLYSLWLPVFSRPFQLCCPFQFSAQGVPHVL